MTQNPVVQSALDEKSKKVTKFGQWILKLSVEKEGSKKYSDKSALVKGDMVEQKFSEIII